MQAHFLVFLILLDSSSLNWCCHFLLSVSSTLAVFAIDTKDACFITLIFEEALESSCRPSLLLLGKFYSKSTHED